MRQVAKSKSDQRCEYELCNAILFNTFRREQKYCNTFCANAQRKLSKSKHRKQISFAKKYAKQIYEAWINSNIPIYKLILLDQVSVKYAILSKKEILWKGEHKRTWLQNYNQTHRKQRALNRRINYHLFIKLSFAKFWELMEK